MMTKTKLIMIALLAFAAVAHATPPPEEVIYYTRQGNEPTGPPEHPGERMLVVAVADANDDATFVVTKNGVDLVTKTTVLPTSDGNGGFECRLLVDHDTVGMWITQVRFNNPLESPGSMYLYLHLNITPAP